MSSLGGSINNGSRVRNPLDGFHRFVDGQRRLRQPRNLRVGRELNGICLFGFSIRVIRSGASPLVPFLLTLVPDRDNFVALGSKPFRLIVNFGHGGRCIDGPEIARCGFLMDRR